MEVATANLRACLAGDPDARPCARLLRLVTRLRAALREARALREAERLPEAAAQYAAAAALDPRGPLAAAAGLSECAIRVGLGDRLRAVHVCLEALEAHRASGPGPPGYGPDMAALHVGLSRVFLSLRDFVSALHHANMAAAHDDGSLAEEIARHRVELEAHRCTFGAPGGGGGI